MRTFSLIILTLLLLSCTTIDRSLVNSTTSITYIHPTLIPILMDFEYEATVRGVFLTRDNLSMNFGEIRDKPTSKVVGYCMKSSLGRMTLMFHTPSWDFMDEYEQEALVFHELGHCLLDRAKHCDTISYKMGGPISLMNQWVLDSSYYKSHREEILDELFNPNENCIADDDIVDEINGEVCSPKNSDPRR